MKFKICVSGASAGLTVNDKNVELSKKLGEAIARSGCVLLTGATPGLPYAAAVGATKAGGVSIGFSPASSISDHLNRYRAPIKNMDLVVYTGFGYAGRDLLLTRSADAVVIIGGRTGTLNEFSVAFEDRKPLGIVAGSGGITDEIPDIVRIARKDHDVIIYEPDPAKLIHQLVSALKEKYKAIKEFV